MQENENKCKNYSVKVCIAAELQKIKNANEKIVGPQLLGISNTFYTFSAPFFLIIPHVTYRL
jgi:hypothetical protein